MRKIPADRHYTEGHLWFQPEDPKKTLEVGFIGLTDAAQMRLGDLIAAELPRSGTTFAAHDVMAYLEGILEPMEVEACTHLEILEVNPKLEIHPDIVNRHPYDEGWIFKVRIKGVARWLDAPSYAEYQETGKVNEGA